VYQGLANTIKYVANEEIDLWNLGWCIILPSSLLNNAHNMFEIFQDSMAITCYFKHPNMFGTKRTKSKWPKINNTLLLEEKMFDWVDLVACVFKFK